MNLGALILGLVALSLHLALSVAAAPLLDAAIGAVAVRLAAGMPAVWQELPLSRAALGAALDAAVRRPWRRLAWLAAGEPVLADNASAVGSLTPLVATAVTLAAAALVPSFSLDLPTGGLADLPVILALLGTARLALLGGGLDIGAAAPGLAAMSLAAAMLLALPGLALGVAVLWSWSGGTGLDVILSGPRDGGTAAWSGLLPRALAALALGLAALSAGDEDGVARELAGPDLALFELQAALRRLVWVELVTALLWPGSLGSLQSGPLRWPLGLLLWTLRIAIAAVVLGMARGRLSMPETRRDLARASALFGAIWPLLMLGACAAA